MTTGNNRSHFIVSEAQDLAAQLLNQLKEDRLWQV